MQQYKDLIKDVLENGIDSNDRTGTGTKSLFGRQLRFDLSKGFPLVTLKKTWWKGVVVELLWLMSGQTNIGFLKKHNVGIWDEWADENGDLGAVYGEQWRKWGKLVKGYDWEKTPDGNEHKKNEYWRENVDQLKKVVERIKTKPNCRRLIVSAWNVGEIEDMALPPCHCFFQFYVRNGKLSCQLYQRSADLFLGVPFNIASYALMTHLIARECGLEPGEFVHTFGDVHLYNNHLDQARELLKRDPKELPQLKINIPQGQLFQFIDEDAKNLTWDEIKDKIELVGYESHPAIKGEVSV